MRLAPKIFLAFSLVILVVAGIAVWSLNEVGNLSITDRNITVKAAEALRSAVSLRESVALAKRVDMRSLVFADPQFINASAAGAALIVKEFDRLDGLLNTDREHALLRKAASAFKDYHDKIATIRELPKRGDSSRAQKLLEQEAHPIIDRVIADLDSLVTITRDALDQNQTEASAALGQARYEIENLRAATWKAVTIAMILAVLLALAGTAFIAFRLTRALAKLSDATQALAAGKFEQPVAIESKDEIGTLAKAFNSMAAQLRETDEMKEKFYATVSHELRSPLNAMSEAARLLDAGTAGPLTAKQKRLIGIFQKGSERLLRLVNEVLDLSQMHTGNLSVTHRWFELNGAVKHAIDELQPQAEQRDIKLRLEAGPGTARMLGDEDRIVQIIVNLVANSLRFTPPHGSVTVRLVHSSGKIHIEVEDSGIGIPAAFVPLVFERFRQAHKGKGGTGLGLAIVKSLVEAHDGEIVVESQEGKGTKFTVTLPRGTPTLAIAGEKEAMRA